MKQLTIKQELPLILNSIETITGYKLACSLGWSHREQTKLLQIALGSGKRLVSCRLGANRIVFGPAVSAETDPKLGCVGCAEYRIRLSVRHILLDDYQTNIPTSLLLWHILALGILREALEQKALGPGEVIVLDALSLYRRQVLRSIRCPLACARLREQKSLSSKSVNGLITDPWGLRCGPNLSHESSRLVKDLVHKPMGPIVNITVDPFAPLAMNGAVLLESQNPGYGRSLTFRSSLPTAILEVYERYAGWPHQAKLARNLSYKDLGDSAINPARLGSYTKKQIASPLSMIRDWDENATLDWVLGRRLGDGKKIYVPAEVGFYLYDYNPHYHRPKGGNEYRLRHARFFAESSSRSALGASFEEALMHSLIELVERDAFLMGWFAAKPLLQIEDSAIHADPECRLMFEAIVRRGMQVKLLAARADIDFPVVWAMAINPKESFPAAFSASGAHPCGLEAIRAALRELVQVVGSPRNWDRDPVRKMLDDPYRVDSLEDHIHLGAEPESFKRVRPILEAEGVSLEEAFGGWPEEKWLKFARKGITFGLDRMLSLLDDAGISEVIAVDQTTTDHRDQGLAVVKAVAPGIVPMNFGQSQQRIAGNQRLSNWSGLNFDDPFIDRFRSYPHPYP